MTNDSKLTEQDLPESHPDWTHRSLSQPLPDSVIHVWCASLEYTPPQLAEFLSLLSADEKARANRFYFERDRSRFIIGRGLLRILLSRYLGAEPSQLEFVYGGHGKPALKSETLDRVLEFNVSHSKDLALYIFSWNHKVGVDVEYVYPLPDLDNFAELFFSPRECAYIHSLSGEHKESVFFKLWTCKEAFLKANGSGLTIPINQVEISLGMEGSAIVGTIDGDIEEAERWHLETFNPIPGYQASLAVEGYDGRVILRQNVNTPLMRF